MLARDQSSTPWSDSSSSTSWCSRSHTAASCHSRSRRQAVCPEPNPSSGGRSRQRHPVTRTNKIPSRAYRSGTRGRPPGPRAAGGGGINGSSSAQSRSSTSRRGGEETRVDMTRDDRLRPLQPAAATRGKVLRPGLSKTLLTSAYRSGSIEIKTAFRAVFLRANHMGPRSPRDDVPPEAIVYETDRPGGLRSPVMRLASRVRVLRNGRHVCARSSGAADRIRPGLHPRPASRSPDRRAFRSGLREGLHRPCVRDPGQADRAGRRVGLPAGRRHPK